MGTVLRNSWTRVRSHLYLVGIVAGLGLLLLAEHPGFEKHPHWQIFTKEVAFALFIASFFSVTVERYQREEFVKLVNQERRLLQSDIFLYTYGYDVPKEIREEIKESVLEEPLYRQDLEIDWEFSPIEGTSEFVELKKKYTYTLVNGTRETLKDRFQFTQISAAEHEVLTETEFVVLKLERDGKTEAFKQSEMEEDRTGQHPHRRRLIKEFEVGPHKSVKIHYVLREPRRRKHADDFYSVRQPLVGQTKIRVRVNPPLKLNVAVACKMKELTTATQHDPPTWYAWVLNQGVLPYQGFMFGWSPMDEKAPDQSGLRRNLNPPGSIQGPCSTG